MGSAADSDFVESLNSQDSADALSSDAESEMSSTIESASESGSFSIHDYGDEAEMKYLGQTHSAKHKVSMIEKVTRSMSNQGRGTKGLSVKSDKFSTFSPTVSN